MKKEEQNSEELKIQSQNDAYAEGKEKMSQSRLHDFEWENLESASKSTLLDFLKKLKNETDFFKSNKILNEIKKKYDAIFNKEKKEALKKFLSFKENKVQDFDYHQDEFDRNFYDLFHIIDSKRQDFFKNIKEENQQKLRKKSEILELLRIEIDSENQTSFNKIKKLQEEWKNIGDIKGYKNKTLWTSYHALMYRFYNQRSLYFQLKELDREKNLKSKIKLCEKAEALDPENHLKDAIVSLNKIHDEFKHIGPVPAENQEDIWMRLKLASDKVYEFKKELTQHQKEEEKENLHLKDQLIAELDSLIEAEKPQIKDWGTSTQKIQNIKKEWEKIGNVPREKAKEINKNFWRKFKTFFNEKNAFFKELDTLKNENLQRKQELIVQSEALKESDNWEETAKKLKELQSKWKKIGSVPEKFKSQIYQEFKSNCDYFFDRKRGQNQELLKEEMENFEKKSQLLAEMENFNKKEDFDFTKAVALTHSFLALGKVPHSKNKEIREKFTAIFKIWTKNNTNESEKKELQALHNQFVIKSFEGNEEKLRKKEMGLRKSIAEQEKDIQIWKNNMQYLENSKNADLLKITLSKKIANTENKLEELKNELKFLKNL